jgi:hypothetical protein
LDGGLVGRDVDRLLCGKNRWKYEQRQEPDDKERNGPGEPARGRDHNHYPFVIEQCG